MPWFFFGTLLDPDVLAIVLGYSPDPSAYRPAYLTGHERVMVDGESFPMLRVKPDSRVDGYVFDALPEDAARRVCFFEDEEFELRPLRVEPQNSPPLEALTFMATEKLHASDEVWTLSDWQARHKADFIPMARDWMAGYGTTDPGELEARWQAELARLRARTT